MLLSTGILTSMAKYLHYIEYGNSIQSMDKKSQCIPISEDLILYLLEYAFENLTMPFQPNRPNKSFHELLNATLLNLSIDRNGHQC
jgi:hypothetical protein